MSNPRLFVTEYGTPQPKLFALDTLGEGGWLKALRLEEYAARVWQRPEALQQTLFPYLGSPLVPRRGSFDVMWGRHGQIGLPQAWRLASSTTVTRQ